ncbi:MAG: flagellar basal body P-ring formation chaperone FlgA [Methylococcaceae bacterium]|jgi:flagella basal body P-ring formation protein FlgA
MKKLTTVCSKALALLVLAHTQNAVAELRYQPHDTIYEVAKSYLAAQVSPGADYEINVMAFDSQLKLAECSQPLQAFSSTDQFKAGRTSVGIRCDGEIKWTVYASALVKIYLPVIVLNQAVQRGELIRPGILSTERKEISSIRNDYVTQPEQVENKQASRYLPAGSIISLRSLVEPLVIKRGDKVTISAGSNAFSIKMNGQAMRDGVKGELIPIKNQSSGRIVSAKVVEQGLVSIIN